MHAQITFWAEKQPSKTSWISDLNSCLVELDTDWTTVTLIYEVIYHMASMKIELKPLWPCKYIQVATKKPL